MVRISGLCVALGAAMVGGVLIGFSASECSEAARYADTEFYLGIGVWLVFGIPGIFANVKGKD